VKDSDLFGLVLYLRAGAREFIEKSVLSNISIAFVYRLQQVSSPTGKEKKCLLIPKHF